jgi:hypothetical protein
MKTNEAIEKITKEMMEANDPLFQAVEEHLTEICTNDQVADCILQEGKTLKGAVDILWNEAKKLQKNSRACIRSDMAFDMVEKYYGIAPDMKNTTVSRAAIVNILDEI